MRVRAATEADIAALTAIDSVASDDALRRAQIQAWCASGACYLVESEGQVMAYGVLNDHFFGCGFIEMLMVAEGCRRQGIGAGLVAELALLCPQAKLFTSTNRSNLAMRKLLLDAGFIESGYIENLDENDPELVFFIRPR
ncbi:Acetyltransferase (GNAT) family [Serratia entomophila]|uniref:GNAT family N-acetyltransferase n=1 Tax=Serratia entomophila TaxID=42906 RepID=A0ABY5CYA3_9GAMM|nr:GNAT family N-acetyltransferase [Serratia entomophila]UIW20307.1 GNAT family N-acetyltransferase [Serratia entomophila]USV02808.1 GNAT family N-acetyltransferase [Serratia entomophila]CAI0713741.1 Acetyltransferase (GNAT) family [Serratia entomophila]CAI0723356.1 Acetyltransferase (GNAT) family [Serratia entomophila]CAI0844790.1 Acetyltransferase (GNAT) family [Serratia entomophila]